MIRFESSFFQSKQENVRIKPNTMNLFLTKVPQSFLRSFVLLVCLFLRCGTFICCYIVFCSFTIRRSLFRLVFSFKLFDYPSEVHLNLVPVEKSSPEWYDPFDSQKKFLPKAELGTPPKE